MPRARIVPLSAPPPSYTAAVERYLTGVGIAMSSARIYRISLTTWGWMLRGGPAATGLTRAIADLHRAELVELLNVEGAELPRRPRGAGDRRCIRGPTATAGSTSAPAPAAR
ncbi:hypothetical protein ACIQCF_36750 [Streptomyces sp. NPDC088353]|uniref:hypothetical protein n=1 Tax=Streptomyces sp. NPDC088353 TaxID=3365855 RepID=UPI0037FBBB27